MAQDLSFNTGRTGMLPVHLQIILYIPKESLFLHKSVKIFLQKH